MNINSIFQKVYPFIQQAISEEGFKVKSLVRVSVPPSVRTSISFFDGGFKLSFPDEKPFAKVPMLPRLTISAIHLNAEGGVVEIDKFPDSVFTWKEIEQILLDLGM